MGEKLDNLKYYMEYFINHRVWREIHNHPKKEISFEDFCSNSNIVVNDAGDDWEKRGYASRHWISFIIPSLQYYKKIGLKIK